ncbi:hypothetical protein [Rhizobium sp. CCGE 510]|uniref:hypothetical protein n=1 Tax=Rhizobium sp. CCGE 510 TaxID=1132836 RepID=UPI00027B7B77|nr:hypothetical protein [Rhizobium sp. CCGE 510]EJT04925.1 hypothetical protein RCCGE510_12356 [Rhizobium sp. CCGE 510]
MTDEEELDLLQQEALSLGKRIGDLDHEIAREVRTFAPGFTDGEKTISRMQDRYEAKLKFVFDLGRVSVHIEDLENRIRQRDALERANALAEGRPVSQEDYLDWIRPSLDAPEREQAIEQESYHRPHEGEERMVQEMHREDLAPDDYPDGWRSR